MSARKPLVRVPRDVRAQAVKFLSARRNANGEVSDADVALVAGRLDVDSRTVRRWLAADCDLERPGVFEINEQHLEVLTASRRSDGKVNHHAAWWDLHESGVIDVSYDTFLRALKRTNTAIVEGIKGGAKGFQDHSLYILQEPDHRNEIWLIDHMEVPVEVVGNFKPWLTSILDAKWRLLIHAALFPGRPNEDDVRALLCEAIRGHLAPGGIFVGGVPRMLRSDNGAELTARSVAAFLVAVGTAPNPHDAYSPWQSAVLERWHRTIQDEHFSKKPGFTKGPRTWTGRDPFREEKLTHVELASDTMLWGGYYNERRKHGGINAIPLEGWANDPAVIELADPEALRLGMLRFPETRIPGKKGVRFRNGFYTGPALRGRAKRPVVIRYLPSELSSIEAYDEDDTWLGTLQLHKNLTAAQRATMLRDRHEDYAITRSINYTGSRLRELAHASVGDDPALPAHLSAVPRAANAGAALDEFEALFRGDAGDAPTPDDEVA